MVWWGICGGGGKMKNVDKQMTNLPREKPFCQSHSGVEIVGVQRPPCRVVVSSNTIDEVKHDALSGGEPVDEPDSLVVELHAQVPHVR